MATKAKKKETKKKGGTNWLLPIAVIGSGALWYFSRQKEVEAAPEEVIPAEPTEPEIIYVTSGDGGADAEAVAAAISAALAQQSQTLLEQIQAGQAASAAQVQALLASQQALLEAQQAAQPTTPTVTATTSAKAYRTMPVEVKPPLREVITVAPVTEEKEAAERAAQQAEESAKQERANLLATKQSELEAARLSYNQILRLLQSATSNYESAKNRLNGLKSKVSSARTNLRNASVAFSAYSQQVNAMSWLSRNLKASEIESKTAQLKATVDRATTLLQTARTTYNNTLSKAESLRTNALSQQSAANIANERILSIVESIQGISLYVNLANRFDAVARSNRSTLSSIERRLAPLSYAYEAGYI